MNLGKLNRELRLEAPVLVPQNGYGEPAPVTYQDMGTAWGQVDPLPGSEGFVGDQLAATSRQKITIRYRADLDATWRVVLDGRAYNISDVQQFGRRDGLILTVFRRG